MPIELRRGQGRTQEDLDLIRRVRDRRALLEMSLRDLARESGFYGASMRSTLERSLRPGGPKVRMSGRGRRSLEAWLRSKDEEAVREGVNPT